MGPKAAEMLRLIPGTEIEIVERCAGHGGTFGVLRPTHEIARKVGAPTVRAAAKQARPHLVSDCPLAGKHIVQGLQERAQKEGETTTVKAAEHPIEIMAQAYGLSF
jgi:glycerol-3-phosphate dehydrogenase subunit C